MAGDHRYRGTTEHVHVLEDLTLTSQLFLIIRGQFSHYSPACVCAVLYLVKWLPAALGIKSVTARLELQTKVYTKLVITEKVPTRAFSWLKADTTAY